MNNCPRIIEIVGLAGTGKSTLVKSMQKRNQQIKFFPLPKTWFSWALAKRFFLWVPLWFQHNPETKPFTREELISLGCIDAWLPYIQLKTSHSSNIAVLDPGSVYWLTKLQGFGSQATGRSLYQRWWEDKFEQWSSALDVVVWLDAPEDLCLQRILARNQWHDAKHMTSKDALSRFRGLRMSYEQIITKMVSKQPKKVFYFRTDQISTEQIVNRLFSEVNFTPRSHAQIDRTDSSTEASDSPTQPRINNSAIHIEY